MTGTGFIGILLIVANVAFSYKGFTDGLFFNKYNFEVEKILIYKDYKRWLRLVFAYELDASYFQHVGLYFFSGSLELYLAYLENSIVIYLL